MRYPLVIGNWKLNGSRQMTSKLIAELRKELINTFNCTIVIAPPSVYLDLAKRAINGSNIILGAQNIDLNLIGPFTGEISAEMLKDIGVKYIIIGHSDRRYYHQESNDIIAKKFAIVKKLNLIPVLCIGETEEENKAGKTKEICARQIDSILKIHGATAFKNTVIAYEPVWAIGTGKVAIASQVQIIHKFIRDYISKTNVNLAKQIIIQYGGSVNASNAMELFKQPDIDGALVGSAALKADAFAAIIKSLEIAKQS